MTEATATRDDYDSPWKEVLEHAFPEFMAFYFPEAHSHIDWSRGHAFKNTELRQVVRDAELGKRFADALVQITLTSGEQSWVYIHIEIQGQRDSAPLPSASSPTITGSTIAMPALSPAWPSSPMKNPAGGPTTINIRCWVVGTGSTSPS